MNYDDDADDDDNDGDGRGGGKRWRVESRELSVGIVLLITVGFTT